MTGFSERPPNADIRQTLRDRLLQFVSLVFLVYVAASSAADVNVRVVRLGSEVAVPNSDLIGRTIALVESCDVESTRYDASPEAWRNALLSTSLVHLRFPTSRDVTVDGKRHAVDEILVPLPDGTWPAHFYARRGETVLSFTFYDPRAFRNLVWGPPFEFQNVPPYDALANLPNY